MKFYLTSENAPSVRRFEGVKGGAYDCQIDTAQWAEVNGTVTTATWTVVAGSATVANTALASDVASATITLGSAGGSLIKISLTNGTETEVMYIDLYARDEQRASNDYWS